MSVLKQVIINYWVFLLVAAVLVTAFALFRSRPTNLPDEEALNRLLLNGQPTIVELYSNF